MNEPAIARELEVRTAWVTHLTSANLYVGEDGLEPIDAKPRAEDENLAIWGDFRTQQAYRNGVSSEPITFFTQAELARKLAVVNKLLEITNGNEATASRLVMLKGYDKWMVFYLIDMGPERRAVARADPTHPYRTHRVPLRVF